jgi:hypothetical protein
MKAVDTIFGHKVQIRIRGCSVSIKLLLRLQYAAWEGNIPRFFIRTRPKTYQVARSGSLR